MLVIVKGSHVLLRILAASILARLNSCVPLRTERRIVGLSVLSIGRIQRRELVGVYLRASDGSREGLLVQIGRVELDVV